MGLVEEHIGASESLEDVGGDEGQNMLHSKSDKEGVDGNWGGKLGEPCLDPAGLGPASLARLRFRPGGNKTRIGSEANVGA